LFFLLPLVFAGGAAGTASFFEAEAAAAVVAVVVVVAEDEGGFVGLAAPGSAADGALAGIGPTVGLHPVNGSNAIG
jgi:hypothetical protein